MISRYGDGDRYICDLLHGSTAAYTGYHNMQLHRPAATAPWYEIRLDLYYIGSYIIRITGITDVTYNNNNNMFVIDKWCCAIDKGLINRQRRPRDM